MSGSECGHVYEHIPMDPRAQAEQRLAAAMYGRYSTIAWDQRSMTMIWAACAKLAAEEIAKAVCMHSEFGTHPYEPLWHLVCANAESAKPEGE